MADAPTFGAAAPPSLPARPVSPLPAKTDVQPVASYSDENVDQSDAFRRLTALVAGVTNNNTGGPGRWLT